MTFTFRVHCKECGAVDIDPASITLKVSASDPACRSYFVYACHGKAIRKPAPPCTVEKLVAGGVRPMAFDLPTVHVKSGPALTMDDLLEFALQLGTTDYLAGVPELAA